MEFARTIPLRTAKCLYKLQMSVDPVDALVASAMIGRYSKTIEKLRLSPSDIEASLRSRPLALLESFHRTAWGIGHQAIVDSDKSLGWVCEGRLLCRLFSYTAVTSQPGWHFVVVRVTPL